MSQYEYMFGETEGEMELLRALGIRSSPLSGYQPYAMNIRLGDGTLTGQGLPVITWHFSLLSVTERAVFVDPMNGNLSMPAFIRTRLPDNTWATFECIMARPTGEENLSNGTIINFDLEFTHCILIPGYP